MKDVCAIPLGSGGHSGPDEGMCVMEMASYLAHEEWGDHPECASPVISSFLRSWNDSLDDETRQRLKPYAFKVIGTNTGPADEETRAWMCVDWLARVQTPGWLRLAGLTAEAQALESLARIADAATASAAQPTLDDARRKADAAGAAAAAAAGAAARAAAGAAARAALRPTVVALQESAFKLLDGPHSHWSEGSRPWVTRPSMHGGQLEYFSEAVA